jgi:hypothetical protein
MNFTHWTEVVSNFLFSLFHTITVRSVLSGNVDAAIISGASESYGTERTEELSYDLQEAGFVIVPGFGYYKGTSEPSIMVLPSNGIKFDDAENLHILRLAKKYHQESVMLIYDGKSALRYVAGIQITLVAIGDTFHTGEDVSCDDACSEFAGVRFSAAFNNLPERGKIWNTTKDADGNSWAQLNETPNPASNWS